MNTNNLHELINRYESNYALFNDTEHDEVFKWRAVQQFHSVWFSEEKFDSFASLFKEAKKECSILIDNAQVSPTNGIVKLSEEFPEEVEHLFRDVLFAPDDGDIDLKQEHLDTFLDEIEKLYSGAKLFLEGDYLKYNFGQYSAAVLKLSKAAHTNIQQLVSKGYTTYKAEVRFVVSWKAKDDIDGVESLIVLPNIYIRKEKTDASVQIKNCKSGYIQ